MARALQSGAGNLQPETPRRVEIRDAQTALEDAARRLLSAAEALDPGEGRPAFEAAQPSRVHRRPQPKGLAFAKLQRRLGGGDAVQRREGGEGAEKKQTKETQRKTHESPAG